jgi:Leucine-rich repeat (LRR) protein
LEELALYDAAVDDTMLERWPGSMPGLQRLTLRNAPAVTDRGIAAVAVAERLTHLVLIDLQINGRALPPLAAAAALAVLDLRMCSSIQSSDLSALAKAPKLKELKLGGYGIDDAAMEIVATLPHLENLTVEDASVGPDGLACLVQNREAAERFHALALARCAGVSDESLRHLASMPNLRRLTLRDVPVTGEFLRELPQRGQLELLSLNQTYLTDDAFEAIAECRKLTRLELSGNFLTAKAIEQIAALSELRYLNLTECGLSDEMVRPLAELKQLRTLIVDGNPDLSPEAVSRLLDKGDDG